MACLMLVYLLCVTGLVAVRHEWEEALAHFGLHRPARVTPANFYRAAGANVLIRVPRDID